MFCRVSGFRKFLYKDITKILSKTKLFDVKMTFSDKLSAIGDESPDFKPERLLKFLNFRPIKNL